MDYKEKYEQALEKARELMNKGYDVLMPEIFPELQKCNDEKIRGAIIHFISHTPTVPKGIIGKKTMLAWLEKQSQKEVTWNKEDEENMNNVLYILYQLKDTSSYEEDNIAEKTINWFKSLKDKLCVNNEYDKDMLEEIEYCKKNNRQLEKEHLAWLEKQDKQNPVRWSEEDEKIKESIKKVLANTDFNRLDIKYSFYEMISWLEKQKDYIKLPNSAYTPNKDVIKFADKYSHDVWEKLMDNFKKIENYHIGCNDVSDIVLNAIINTYNWLEKQDEQKPTLPKWKYRKDRTPLLRDSLILNKYGCVAKSPSGAIVSDVWVLDYDELAKLPKEELEKQGEQKPDDKVESKFHKGDWIIHQGTGNIYRVVAHIDNQYQLKYGDSYTIQRCDDVDRGARLWNISDVKDGDVLAAQECYVIFKEIDGLNIKCYCTYHYMNNPSFHVDTLQNKDAFHPATEEQCDTLMKAVANAGYTFDFEKKELKKIEPKTLDSDKVIE